MTGYPKAELTRLPRNGFTLVELLIVIGFIAFLVTLGAGVYMTYPGIQMKSNTTAQLRALQGALRRQWSITVDFAKRQPLPIGLISYADNNVDRARIILIKLYLKQAFPVTFDEALGGASCSGWSLPPLGTFKGELQGQGSAASQYESSVLLLLALERNGVLNRENLGSAVTSTQIGNRQFDYIRDGWGNPLVFARCPMESPQSTNAAVAVTGVTNTNNPTITTSSSHGLSVGQVAVIQRVGGATGVNAPWLVASTPSSTQFTIVTGAPGAYTSGGTVNPYTDSDDTQGLLASWPSGDPTNPCAKPWSNQTDFFATVMNHAFVPNVNLAPQVVSAGGDGRFGLTSFSNLGVDPSRDAQDNITSAALGDGN